MSHQLFHIYAFQQVYMNSTLWELEVIHRSMKIMHVVFIMVKCIGIDNEDVVFQVETSIQVMCLVFLIQ